MMPSGEWKSRRVVAAQRQVGLVVGLDGAQVLPVAVEDVGHDAVGGHAPWEHLFPEIRRQRRGVSRSSSNLALEHVDAMFAR